MTEETLNKANELRSAIGGSRHEIDNLKLLKEYLNAVRHNKVTITICINTFNNEYKMLDIDKDTMKNIVNTRLVESQKRYLELTAMMDEL